jgi:hypothetical protein
MAQRLTVRVFGATIVANPWKEPATTRRTLRHD